MKGAPRFNVDPAKTTPSKQKCLEASDLGGLLEQWGNGEIKTEDTQVMLLAFLLSWVAQSAQSGSGKIVAPRGYGPF
jgi:hypothetical protein